MSKKKKVATKNQPHRRFRHYHLHGVEGIESVTVVVEEIEKKDDYVAAMWKVSWAICNPADNFSRFVGRTIAISTLEERGYTFLLMNDKSNPIDTGVDVLMTSDALSTDPHVLKFRRAMKNLLTEDKKCELRGYYRCLAIAHEKVDAVRSFISNFGKN